MRIVGPCTLECPERCEVPAGAEMSQVPIPRHNWGDVAVCPNDGCDRAFLLLRGPDGPEDIGCSCSDPECDQHGAGAP